jgi:hypothetical protein
MSSKQIDKHPRFFLKLPKLKPRQNSTNNNNKDRLIPFQKIKKDCLSINPRFHSLVFDDKRYTTTMGISTRNIHERPYLSSQTLTSYGTDSPLKALKNPAKKKEIFYKLTGNINLSNFLNPHAPPDHTYKNYVRNYDKYADFNSTAKPTTTSPSRKISFDRTASKFNSTGFLITRSKGGLVEKSPDKKSKLGESVMREFSKSHKVKANKKNSIFERRFIKNHRENYNIDHIIEEHRNIKSIVSGRGDIYSKLVFPDEIVYK